MPASVSAVSGSANNNQAITAVQGGTRYSKLVTAVAAPRWISRYSSELPPSVRASTDQAMAPASCPFHCMASLSSRASGNVTTNAAASCTRLAVRTSQAVTKRFWYSVPTVMLASAIRANTRLSAWISPAPSLCHKTSARPPKPSARPAHCLALTRPPRKETQTAVNTGCKLTSNATSPAPMPSLTAVQTPPR